MEIKVFKKRKQMLERDLAVAIEKLVSEFEDETGYSPNSIYVDCVATREMQDERERYIIGEVRTSIDL